MNGSREMKFNDLKAKLQYIQKWQNAAVAHEMKKQYMSGGSYTAVLPDLQKLRLACERKHHRYYGNSRYMPHQGHQECERRRCQQTKG